MPKRKAAIKGLAQIEQQEAGLAKERLSIEGARSQLAALQAQ